MCKCRKPKPGLILQAAKDNDIDLTKSWFVGDRPSDIGAATNAGCFSVAVLSGYLNKEKIAELPSSPHLVFPTVLQFAEYLQLTASSRV
jgi:D-glycero-D-manno-heptose 1,7-bisphosphate phosphatase